MAVGAGIIGTSALSRSRARRPAHLAVSTPLIEVTIARDNLEIEISRYQRSLLGCHHLTLPLGHVVGCGRCHQDRRCHHRRRRHDRQRGAAHA
jgi:hypothetical protein